MSEHSETAANAPAQPRPCKMGCGFFGSIATGDCCSKCWREKNLAGKNNDAAPVCVPAPATSTATVNPPVDPKKVVPMEVEEASNPVTTSTLSTAPPPQKASPLPMKKKSKKKKSSYKAMMVGMLQGQTGTRDIEKEKEDLRKVTG